MKSLYIDIFENVKGITAFFSTKYGASNGSPYYNEETLAQLELTDRILIQPQQVHEAKIGVIGSEKCRIAGEDGSIVDEWERDEQERAIVLPRTDGVITDQKDVLLTTVHADCLPVWLYDEQHKAIGLVHAGWRGTLVGIAPKAVKMMKDEYGSDPAKLKAYIGPGISLCCFETGPEVIEAFREAWDFADDHAESAEERAAAGKPANPGKYYIDLKSINLQELLQAGLVRENIGISGHCTCCELEMFASYRREGGTYMRMGAGICLTEDE